MPGYPDMLVLGNTEAKDRDDAVRNGAAYWHTDQSYTDNPVRFTMLYSIEAPQRGGETLIADMAAAYDALDSDVKHRIDGLEVTHFRGAASRREDEHETTPFKNAEQAAKVPPVKHPLVRRHPISDQLLDQLKAHATSPPFVYARKHEVGDIALYDTNATLHSATQIDVASGPNDSRVIWRISVHGPPTLGGRV